eukprot:jgi/Botrbrau1/22844/Bobra.0065s0003.1
MSEEKKSATLRLRGLPFSAEEADVRDFFGDDFEVASVYICKKNSRNSGEAYVTFSSAVVAANARQKKDKETMGTRYIEIFEVREDEEPPMREDDDKTKGFVLRLRGLPYSATEEDVRVFFKDLEIAKEKNAIVIALTSGDKKPLGEAYVEFFSEGAYMEALQRNKQKMGERYIELFPSSRGDLKQQLQSQQGGRRGDQGFIRGGRSRQQAVHPVSIFPQAVPSAASLTGPQAATDGSTIKLRGLPFSTTVDDIIQFFEGFNLNDSSIHVVPKHDRTKSTPQCSGIAYVQFESPDVAKQAREAKDRQTMGSRYVECMPYNAPRHLEQSSMMGYQQAAPFGLPTHMIQERSHQLPRGSMHMPPGAYGPGSGPPHMQPYGPMSHQPPPPPQGGQSMGPSALPGMGRGIGGGRMGQGNGGRGGRVGHPHYQQHAPAQAIDYSQQPFVQPSHAYYQQQPLQQQPPQYQQQQQQQQQWGATRDDASWAPPGAQSMNPWSVSSQQTGTKYNPSLQGGGPTGILGASAYQAYGVQHAGPEHSGASGSGDVDRQGNV